MIDINDILLVERHGELFKSSLANLQLLYLPKNQNDKVLELESAIDELSAYVTNLSATIIKNNTSISELNERYEQILSTDYMKEDPSILDEDEIYATLGEKNIVLIDDIEDAYSRDSDKCEAEFDRVSNKIGTSWFS